MYTRAQSYPTLCGPTGCSLPGSSVHRIIQATILEWVAISFKLFKSLLFSVSLALVFHLPGQVSKGLFVQHLLSFKLSFNSYFNNERHCMCSQEICTQRAVGRNAHWNQVLPLKPCLLLIKGKGAHSVLRFLWLLSTSTILSSLRPRASLIASRHCSWESTRAAASMGGLCNLEDDLRKATRDQFDFAKIFQGLPPKTFRNINYFRVRVISKIVHCIRGQELFEASFST